MANKMTKKDYFAILRESYDVNAENYDEVIAFIDHEIELIDRKRENAKMSDNQLQNEKLKEEIVDVLRQHNDWLRISDLQERSPVLAGFTNQKINSLLIQLKAEEKIVKKTEKRVTYFKIA